MNYMLKRLDFSKVPILQDGGNIETKEEAPVELPGILSLIEGYVPQDLIFEEDDYLEDVPEEKPKKQKRFLNSDVDKRADYIKDVLVDNGLQDWEAIGFVAVMFNESGLRPDAENQMEKKKWTGSQSYKYGRGLCQWSLDRNNDFRNFTYRKYGKAQWASDASIDDQLEFALFERSNRDALLEAIQEIKMAYEAGKIDKEQAAIFAADAYRRGFENGSSSSLASSKQMDSYTKVGSPSAKGFTSIDTKAVKKFIDLI